MMKKCLICFLLVMQFAFFFSGCKGDISIGDYDFVNPLGDKNLEGRKKGEEIMDYLKTGNVEAFKDMFCKVLQDQDDFSEKIDEIMSFIDGEIISYNKIVGGAGGRGEAWEQLAPNVNNIETSKGNFYKIYISIYIQNENPDKLGINSFKICLLGEKNEYGNRKSIDDVSLYIE
ncbi:MAG: DUF5104 domain-containing protein [Oscillospiraceae bacterium]|nr:DUF5104 domain-containing protein [Oscillospiraceae bacterium]